MLFEDLPAETVTQIFLHAPTVSSALALSSTCHYFRKVYTSSKKLIILSQAVETQYGPLHDAIQLITHNSSQPAQLVRSAPLSEALVRSVVQVGQTAARWEELYPFKKWKSDFQNRRLLTDKERYLVRRALYRLWLFTRAFHTRTYSRMIRGSTESMRERAALLHNFNTDELSEMLDVHNVLRDTVGSNVCPSNGTIRRKFQKRFPESNYQLLFNIHLNYPPPSSFVPSGYYHSSANMESKFHNKFTPSRHHEPGAEGWGDDILHYYVVEDMLKLDPEQILYLKDNCPYKAQVEGFTQNLGEWFTNNGETFCQTLGHVIYQRGGEMEELREAVRDGEAGVTLGDFAGSTDEHEDVAIHCCGV